MGSVSLNLNVLSARSLNLFILYVCVCVTFSGKILLGNYSPEKRY